MKFYDNGDGLTEPRGFFCSGVHCDIKGKKDRKLDLGLVYSPKPCAVAAVFTTNDIKAAPVQYSQSILAKVKTGFQQWLPIVEMQMLVQESRVWQMLKKWVRKQPDN